MTFELKRVVIYVSNPIKCATFYRDHFSLQPVGEWSDVWAEVAAGGCNLLFHQAYGDHGPETKPTGSPEHPHKISFFVKDIEDACKKLQDAGIRISEIKNYDGWKMANGYDVEGHAFQLTNQ